MPDGELELVAVEHRRIKRVAIVSAAIRHMLMHEDRFAVDAGDGHFRLEQPVRALVLLRFLLLVIEKEGDIPAAVALANAAADPDILLRGIGNRQRRFIIGRGRKWAQRHDHRLAAHRSSFPDGCGSRLFSARSRSLFCIASPIRRHRYRVDAFIDHEGEAEAGRQHPDGAFGVGRGGAFAFVIVARTGGDVIVVAR